MPTQSRDPGQGSSAVRLAMVLMSLLAISPIPRAIAHQVKEGKRTKVDLAGLTPAVATRPLATTVNHGVLAEAPLEAAIRMLFCLEVRDAVNKGQLYREGQQWILINGHRCQDDRLLFDALGF